MSFDDSGTGGSGASTSSTSGSGGSQGSCLEGSVCSQEGATCTDNGCCPCSYTCSGGRWTMGLCAGCVEPACPVDPPINGAACDYCGDPIGIPCGYENCSGNGVSTATCTYDDGDGSYRWVVDAEACQPAPPCGAAPTDPPCADGQLCVIAEVTAGPMTSVFYSCEDNPCTLGSTSCDCALSLCQQTNAPLCVSADPRSVVCENGAQ